MNLEEYSIALLAASCVAKRFFIDAWQFLLTDDMWSNKSGLVLGVKLNMWKQPSRGVLKKCCSEKYAVNLQENISTKKWNHTSVWVFSCKFGAYFQNTDLDISRKKLYVGIK